MIWIIDVITKAKADGILDSLSAVGSFGAMAISLVALWQTVSTRREMRRTEDPGIEVELQKIRDHADWLMIVLLVRNHSASTIEIDRVSVRRPRLAKLLRPLTEEIARDGRQVPNPFEPSLARPEIKIGRKILQEGGMHGGGFSPYNTPTEGDVAWERLFLHYAGLSQENNRNRFSRHGRTLRLNIVIKHKSHGDRFITYKIHQRLPSF